MKLTQDQLKKRVIVAANKMALPLSHYVQKQIKTMQLDDQDILHLTLNAMINLTVKVMFDLRDDLRKRGADIEISGMTQFILDNSLKHFEMMDVRFKQPQVS